MSVLSSLLFYWRILPPIVRGFSWALERTLDVGGAAGLSTAANIFVGQVEAPLFIRPYLDKLSRSEMFIVMTGGMAGIAGTVFVLYATILANAIPNAAGHIAVCSVLAAPAAIVISLLMVPDPNRRHTGGRLDDVKQTASGTMDAIVQGTGAGLELLLNIVAMLIVFVALVYLANSILGLLPDFLGGPITLQRALGWIMAPICWLIGIPWSQAVTAGGLMGIKTVLNELVAYLELAALPDGALDPRSRLILLYAMCGFANFGSLGIMIAGLATMCPGKRGEVVSLGLKSIVSGTLTTCLLGAKLAIDGADFGRPDQPRMRHRHRVQWSFKGLQPEVEEFVERRKCRAEIVVLPDIGLKEPRMIWPPVEDISGRQSIALELLAKVLRHHRALHPAIGNVQVTRSSRQAFKMRNLFIFKALAAPKLAC